MRNAETGGFSIKSWPDAWSGAFFALLGGGASIYSMLAYRLGTPASMGPGFFPALVGAVICLLGIVIFLLSLGAPASEPGKAEGGHVGYIFATLAVVTVAILGFALLLQRLRLSERVALRYAWRCCSQQQRQPQDPHSPVTHRKPPFVSARIGRNEAARSNDKQREMDDKSC